MDAAGEPALAGGTEPTSTILCPAGLLEECASAQGKSRVAIVGERVRVADYELDAGSN
jgi:hypothetical protein